MSPHEIFLIQEWRAPFPVIQRALRGIISYILPEENLIALTCQPVYEVLIDEAGNTGTWNLLCKTPVPRVFHVISRDRDESTPKKPAVGMLCIKKGFFLKLPCHWNLCVWLHILSYQTPQVPSKSLLVCFSQSLFYAFSSREQEVRDTLTHTTRTKICSSSRLNVWLPLYCVSSAPVFPLVCTCSPAVPYDIHPVNSLSLSLL